MAIVKQTPLPIIISGTGPAALLLGHALLRAKGSPRFRLYERDRSMQQRAQGYRFKISGRGFQSVRDNLSPENFALLRATCGDNRIGFKQVDPTTGKAPPLAPGINVWRESKGKPQDDETLTADRNIMRQVLFRGLEAHTTFGKEIVGYSDQETPGEHDIVGGVLVRFADGSTERAALLVAADGAHSKIRSQLQPGTRPLDTEARMVFGKTPLGPDFYNAAGFTGRDDPHIAELLECFTMVKDDSPENSSRFFMYETMTFGERQTVEKTDHALASCIPADYIYWALALRSDHSKARDRDWQSMTSSAASDFAIDLVQDCHPSLRTIITRADKAQTMPLRSVVMPLPLDDWHKSPTDLDTGSRCDIEEDTHRVMVTLIGDAAHAMPPTGGLGATTALTDAAVLGAALAEHGVTARALQVYEEEMREYAGVAIEKSMKGGKHIINMRGLGELKAV